MKGMKKKQKKLKKLIHEIGVILDGQDFEMIGNVFSIILSNMIETVPPHVGILLVVQFSKKTLEDAYGIELSHIEEYIGPLQ